MTDNHEAIRYTADVVCIRGADVLMIERRWSPFEGQLALPGGHVDPGESSLDAAVRELFEETRVRVATEDLTLIGVYDHPDRDPRGRYVTAAYAVRVPASTTATAWDDAAAVRWVPLQEPGDLAFDHASILADARLRFPDFGAAVGIEFVSFGFLHGPAPEADLVIDMRRHFRDPHVHPEMRQLTAEHELVTRAVFGTPGVPELARATLAAVDAFRAGPSGGTVRVAVGCAGGRHRSAAMVNHLAMQYGAGATVEHRDIHRDVVER
ncbi:RapZ C-terminal domain-containing protein [Streptomyces sp. SD11]|uniref:RapZ C-terminal domain-containing protein n=1 Tax=Streptomyces sp. SD11 TaxID=3452209 RepID=UPI003F89553B